MAKNRELLRLLDELGYLPGGRAENRRLSRLHNQRASRVRYNRTGKRQSRRTEVSDELG